MTREQQSPKAQGNQQPAEELRGDSPGGGPTRRVLVCGGRDFTNYRAVATVLDELHAIVPIAQVIEGGATGADHCASLWAKSGAVATATFRADWPSHGKAAGPIRNQRMLDEGRPELVVAFPGGRGTADMVRRARKRGIDVIEIEAATAAPNPEERPR